MSKTSKVLLWVLLGVVIVLVLSVVLSSTLFSVPEIDTSEVWKKIESQEITKVYVHNYNMECYDSTGKLIYKATMLRSDEEVKLLIQYSEDPSLNFSYDSSDPNAGSFMSYLVPLIGVVLVCVVF